MFVFPKLCDLYMQLQLYKGFVSNQLQLLYKFSSYLPLQFSDSYLSGDAVDVNSSQVAINQKKNLKYFSNIDNFKYYFPQHFQKVLCIYRDA